MGKVGVWVLTGQGSKKFKIALNRESMALKEKKKKKKKSYKRKVCLNKPE